MDHDVVIKMDSHVSKTADILQLRRTVILLLRRTVDASPDDVRLKGSFLSAFIWNFCWEKQLISRISCFWQLDVSDDDEADSLIKEAEGSDDEQENDDDDLLPF